MKKYGLFTLVALSTIIMYALSSANAESNIATKDTEGKFFKKPDFIIKGKVVDSTTGKPIVGAKVGDTERYNGGKFQTTTDANGDYSYITWYEEHDVKSEADGYKRQDKGFGTKLFGSEKDKVINFALEPEKDKAAEGKKIIATENTEDTEIEKTKQGDFMATLSNGVTVELIGVCEHPSKGKQWWRPDGEIIKDMPYEVGGQIIEPTEGDQRLDLIAKIINANEQSPGVKFIIPGATRTSVGKNVAINQMNLQMGMWAVRFKIDSALNFADITAGVASGEWQTISKIISSFKNIQRSDVDFGQIEWLKVIEENNEVAIYVSNNFSDKAEFQIIAEDIIGEIYPAYSSRCKGNAGLMSCEYKFHLSLNKTKEFKFQIRPYEWVEFKNVSLKPNFKTDVKIKVEKDTSEKSALDSRTNVSFRRDMSIRDALRFLGEKYKKNIIPSDKINGELAVRELYDVTFEEILKAVIGTNKYIIDGNFIRVYTAEEYKDLQPNVKTDVQIGTVEDSRKLLMERRDILQKTLHDVEMCYNAGRVDSKQIGQVKIDLLRVEIELSETPQKRIELLSQIVTIYAEREKSTKLLLDAGRATRGELDRVKLQRLNAEEELAKATAETKKI